MGFNCISCGICCSIVGNVIGRADLIGGAHGKALKEFPFEINENGVCSKLNENDQCSCYEDRPDICSAERSHTIIRPDLTLDEWYANQEENCRSLMSQAGWTKEEIEEAYRDYGI